MVTSKLGGLAALLTVLAVGTHTAQAQQPYNSPTPVRTIVVHQAPEATPVPTTMDASGASGDGAAYVPMYPLTNSPLYPAPVPHVPYQMGGTAITNQAFAPHEFLYPHTYRAMYGPFYYKVNGHWVACPFGSKTYENWELMGTEVEVKYKSHISPLSRFVAPLHKRH
jgi:hypothetical protein